MDCEEDRMPMLVGAWILTIEEGTALGAKHVVDGVECILPGSKTFGQEYTF